MTQPEITSIFLAKAEESIEGAGSELANGRFNNCANRCYYACFQAAIACLLRAGIQSTNRQWSHEFVHAQFVGELINRRKLYPSTLRQALANTQSLRLKADYREANVTQREASHALDWSTELVTAAAQGGDRG